MFAVAACVIGAAVLAGYYAVQATSWAVMTDELQVARLATSIAQNLSPIPEIHGRYYGALGQLYPLLLAPFYGSMSAPAAQTAAHLLNGILLASAAVPAFLLARSVAASRGAGYLAAALVAFTPWLALASTILTENAAYPVFTWSAYLCHRALSTPSRGRDVAALAGLGLAFFARTQLFVLAAAFPIALLIHELAFAVAGRDGSRAAALRRGAKRAVGRHPVLTAAYLVGLVGCAALAVSGSLGALVGNYATPFHGDLVPGGFWHAAAAHLDQVAVGAGIVPLALAASWAFTALARPERKEAHAFAALLLVLVPLLTVEVTSFDLRFTPEGFIQDRYLFYLVPLLAVGSAAWLTQRTERALRSVSLLVAGGVVALLLSAAIYRDRTIIFWASPAAAFHPAIADTASVFRLSAGVFLPLAALVLVLVLAVAAWLAPRMTMVAAGIALAAFGAFEAGYVLHRYAEPVMTRRASAPTRDWIDGALPAGQSVALVPSPRDAPAPWWEAELWNKDVDRVLRIGSGTTFSPFPADRVSVDYLDGRLRGPIRSADLVVSESETRFHLFGATTIADGRWLRLVRARRPYRLSWATRGLTPDGWTRPLGLTGLRLYGRGEPVRRMVVLTLAAPRSARKPVNFYLRSGDQFLPGSVDPGGARPPVKMAVCVPAQGFVDVTMLTSGNARIPDGRHVGLHVDHLRVLTAGRCHAPTGFTTG
ncbi:MAG TPA: hypothetical protein VFK76_06845 [Gaiellaceae bacterium]|nr:hypothetical protein [Gaiellaceae bacterium]